MPKCSAKPRKPTQRQRDLTTWWACLRDPPTVTLVCVGTEYETIDLETARAIRACLRWEDAEE